MTWDLLGYNEDVALQILLTNDDGLHAPGLAELRAALDGLGDIWTIAPDHDASAVARGITIHRPLHVRAERFGEGWHGFACDGTPSDCVRVALVGARCPVPDLVVSGVNAGLQHGRRHHLLGYGGRRVRGCAARLPRARLLGGERVPRLAAGGRAGDP